MERAVAMRGLPAEREEGEWPWGRKSALVLQVVLGAWC